MSGSQGTKVIGNFGRLWGRGHEQLGPSLRRILSVSGPGATHYLQGLVTSDLASPPPAPKPEPIGQAEPGVPKKFQSISDLQQEDYGLVTFDERLRSTCFLDSKGRILTDSLLWKVSDEQYFIDVPTSAADLLLTHLKKFILRRTKVDIEDKTEQMSTHVIFGSLNAEDPPPPPGIMARMDPRHPSLGMRVLENKAETPAGFDFSKIMSKTFPHMEGGGNYELVRRLAGVPEGAELTGQIALQANQDFLNAVSFHKGCYLGQELTARVQHTGAIRKRILPLLLLDKSYIVPRQWQVAAHVQRGRHNNRYSEEELRTLPSRQPRLSAYTAGHFVMMASGGMIDPEQVRGTLAEKEYAVAQELLETLQDVAVSGATITDTNDDQMIAKILTPPLPGTNIVTALCRLDSMALMGNNMWTHHNKVRIGDSNKDFRYLPYLPLWWPVLDPESGKAKELTDEELEEERKRENLWDPKPGEQFQGDKISRLEGEDNGDVDEDGEAPSVGLMMVGGAGTMRRKEEIDKEKREEMENILAGKHKKPYTPKTDWFEHSSRKTNEKPQ